MLRVDQRARGRLIEIIASLRQRIDEAHHNGWRGEAQGLQTSLDAATAKLVGLDRAKRAARSTGPISLGIPEARSSVRVPAEALSRPVVDQDTLE